MTAYAAAIDDALATFKSLGARSELSQLMHDLYIMVLKPDTGTNSLQRSSGL